MENSARAQTRARRGMAAPALPGEGVAEARSSLTPRLYLGAPQTPLQAGCCTPFQRQPRWFVLPIHRLSAAGAGGRGWLRGLKILTATCPRPPCNRFWHRCQVQYPLVQMGLLPALVVQTHRWASRWGG